MNTPTLQIGQLASQLGAQLSEGGHSRGTAVVCGLLPLDAAQAHHVSFYGDPRYKEALARTRAGAVLCPRAAVTELAARYPERTWLGVDHPALAAVEVAKLFAPPSPPASSAGSRHPTAWVAPTAEVAPSARLGAYVVVEAGASVGAHCQLAAHSFVGPGAKLADDVVLHPGAKVLDGCQVGPRCILHAGSVVGSDGFGYVLDPASRRRIKVPQTGNVVLGCDVELGANTTVDRATFGSTTVGDGCKLDNLVMVAHNVQLGRDCVLVSQSGVAGSARLGARVVAGAQSGIVGHVQIADDVQLAARSGVSKDVAEPGTYGGLPLMPHRAWLRLMASLRNLVEMRRELTQLRHQVTAQRDRER